MNRILLAIGAVLALALPSWGSIDGVMSGLKSGDQKTVDQSVAMLRQAGPDGLNSLLKQYDAHPDASLLPDIDAVAGQHDAIWSRLYWYTDLSQAEAAAGEQHKPILYLRLMGKLTDEYSCANSRFFRTILYSDSDVSRVLRDQFILVWVSERPVPVITIDYGDGRMLKRTITGNSCQYVLDCNGNVVDVLPGIFSPELFKSILQRDFQQMPRYLPSGATTSPAIRLTWIEDQYGQLSQEYVREVSSAGKADSIPAQVGPPNALAVAPLSLTKMFVEAPILKAAALRPNEVALTTAIKGTEDTTWTSLADLAENHTKLDIHSLALMRTQNPVKFSDQAEFDATVDQFQKLISYDSVRDNLDFRRQALGWLRESKDSMSVEDLNQRVYNELFQTPATDPWLGLVPEHLYSALDNDGQCVAPNTTAAVTVR